MKKNYMFLALLITTSNAYAPISSRSHRQFLEQFNYAAEEIKQYHKQLKKIKQEKSLTELAEQVECKLDECKTINDTLKEHIKTLDDRFCPYSDTEYDINGLLEDALDYSIPLKETLFELEQNLESIEIDPPSCFSFCRTKKAQMQLELIETRQDMCALIRVLEDKNLASFRLRLNEYQENSDILEAEE